MQSIKYLWFQLRISIFRVLSSAMKHFSWKTLRKKQRFNNRFVISGIELQTIQKLFREKENKSKPINWQF